MIRRQDPQRQGVISSASNRLPCWLGLAALLMVQSAAAGQLLASDEGQAVDRGLFPLPEALRSNVSFWHYVYSELATDQLVIHDARFLDLRYAVVELGDLKQPGTSNRTRYRQRREHMLEAEDEIRARLRKLGRSAADGGVLDEESSRLEALLSHLPGGRGKYLEAAERVRSQSGLKDQFEAAVELSGRWLPALERIFAEEGLPTELSRLPFVESMFQTQARSSAGAVGAWQFTLATGRQYLEIGPVIDARLDVLLGGSGAARKLKSDYELLKSWPLAITAYNHGRAGMARAVRRLGTRNLGLIATRYRSRTFGFASRNFYAEFVAAAGVYSARERHFPAARPEPELRFDTFRPAHFVSLPQIAEAARIELEKLRELNPALTPAVLRGAVLIPRGHSVRIPVGTSASLRKAYEALPADQKHDAARRASYRVGRGDTLGFLARRFRTTVAAIQTANGLNRPDRIYPGQLLWIPSSVPPHQAPVESQLVSRATVHTVRPGEHLTAIARRYGLSLGELEAANELASKDHIMVDQRLRIPNPATRGLPSAPTYVVRRGDTLYRIARLYGTTVLALTRANQLSSNIIQPGQTLVIP